MNLYPAISGTMGSWQYYIVKMTMRELADNVGLASEIYKDKTLNDAIQRVVNENRVKSNIVRYLQKQDDRFFSSIVVAALKGNPKWYPISIENDERFDLFRDDDRLNSTFGVLSFNGKQNYYALDGQHRLSAIKALVDQNSDASRDAPIGFREEEISVIVVIPEEGETDSEFLVRYRRLFGNLNRHATPTDHVTNIIMDEDDAFAIVTRRLVMEHEFFRYSGRDSESDRVKTEKGKNVNSKQSYFTSLEMLYDINITLLSSLHRINTEWAGQDPRKNRKTFAFSKLRPDDDVLETYYSELCLYWDALIHVLPVLRSDPRMMRRHDAIECEGDEQDLFIFWPIGQLLLAELARNLWDHFLDDPSQPTKDEAIQVASGLGKVSWDMHSAPLQHLILIQSDPGVSNWSIRNEERKPALEVARRIYRWQLGHDCLSDEDVKLLNAHWRQLLYPSQSEAVANDLWQEIESQLIQ